MLPQAIDSLTLADLQKLVDDEVQESMSIEYKRESYRLDATDPKDRVKQHEELLKDVSSFANTVGGHLILGIEQRDGMPVACSGIDCTNPDALISRLTQIVEAGLEPRINFSIRAVANDGKFLFVIRVEQSLLAPHRVVHQQTYGQFWARSSNGACRMNTEQLRQSFTFSSTVFDQIKGFRISRVKSILANDTPIPMPKGSRLIFHLIPQASFASRVSIDLSAVWNLGSNLRPLSAPNGFSPRINMDGIVTYIGLDSASESRGGYVQLFRNGIIEVVADDIVYETKTVQPKKYLRTSYENNLVQQFPEYMKVISMVGGVPPIWCFTTLTAVKGVAIRTRSATLEDLIDRDHLYLPEVEIVDIAAPPLEILRPIFDMIWNSSGFPKCLSFDENGKWRALD